MESKPVLDAYEAALEALRVDSEPLNLVVMYPIDKGRQMPQWSAMVTPEVRALEERGPSYYDETICFETLIYGQDATVDLNEITRRLWRWRDQVARKFTDIDNSGLGDLVDNVDLGPQRVVKAENGSAEWLALSFDVSIIRLVNYGE